MGSAGYRAWPRDPPRLAFIGLETTGDNPVRDRITRIGVLEAEGDRISTWSTLVNPQRPIPEFIQQRNRIRNEAVVDAPTFSEIAAELAGQLPQPSQGRFDSIGKTLTAVDGSVVDTIVKVSRLAWLPKGGGKMTYGYRLHPKFEIFRGTVHRVDATGSKPKDEADERAVMARTVESDRCYLMDRGYAKFTLWNDIHAANSSYVCRVRDNSVYEVIDEKSLTDADRKAGVISDQIVKIGASRADTAPDHTVRLVIVSASEHTSRGNRATGSSTGPSCDGKLRLATDLLEIPAELIAVGYRLRWLIELFFRMFKQLLGCRHLLSTKQNGVEIQAYLAIIACLLILIYTGRAPTKRTFEMICLYMSGWASLEELERHIEKLRPAKK